MNYTTIEKEARRLQFEIYSRSKILFPLGTPAIERMFTPEVGARVLGYEYETRDRIAPVAGESFKAAGQVDNQRRIISVSSEFSIEERRFTGAHELGHITLHPWMDNLAPHRDRPIATASQARGRPQHEKEADYFGACYLAPRKIVLREFLARFGAAPLFLTESLAFHLGGKHERLLATASPGSLDFAIAVAGARKLDGRHFTSLAEHFGMSVSAMAIRLRELNLVAD